MNLDSQVGPYRILRLIHQGGQGNVFLGSDQRLQRRVAVKIYTLPAKHGSRKQLQREAQLVASMHSHKVVQIYDVVESSKHLALIMEYVPGSSLEEFLAAVRPSLASVLTVGADIAGALALARQQHIVHGDVKAANVLITEFGRAKLTDFGIARVIGEEPSREWAAGSFHALSPEQYLGHPLDERADLFALGCLFYRMLSGEQPFFRDGQPDPNLLLTHPARSLTDIVGGDVELPEQLIELIGGLLQKDPANRVNHAGEVRQILRSLLRRLPISSGNSLLLEARPHFRCESPTHRPLLIPKSLGHQTQFAPGYSGTRLAGFWRRIAALRWPVRAAVALAMMMMITIALVITRQSRVTPVGFALAITSVSTETELLPGISPAWLVQEVKKALVEQLGRLRIIDPVEAIPRTTLYSAGELTNWSEAAELNIQISLHCAENLCVFGIHREQSGSRFNEQGILFPDMSLQQWQDIVRSTTLALYR
jgi:serine/threonine protein kinase